MASNLPFEKNKMASTLVAYVITTWSVHKTLKSYTNKAGSLQEAIADTWRENVNKVTLPCATSTFQSKETTNRAFYEG